VATFVIVHGAWGGGWQWRQVALLLRTAGHEVFTPTLTGLGERAHLARPETDLSVHIQDVLGVLEYEDLRGVVLVGHSYGGMVVTGAADRAPDRLAHLVYLDAYAPRDGQSMLDLIAPARLPQLEEQARTVGDGWRLPPPEPITDPRKRVHQPYRTYQEPVRLTQGGAPAFRRTFIRCAIDAFTGRADGPAVDNFAPYARRAQAEGWGYRELAAAHSCPETAPEAVAEVLLELV
jgi:pimeloyl-ACP methyl ester carboxylesterase